MKGNQLNAVTIELTGSYPADEALANAQAGFAAPQGWTWHHLDDFDPMTGEGTVQLIHIAHQATNPHYGGAGQFYNLNGWGYGR